MAHDFKNFPELTNNQMNLYYFESPHKQLVGDFKARVVKVIDGDTVRLEIDDRDFSFPLRLSKIAAPELDEKGGIEGQRWLENIILGEEVDIKLTKKRVEKWGRLLGSIIFLGIDMGKASMDAGYSVAWEQRKNNIIPEVDQWF